MYGRGLLLDAAAYASDTTASSGKSFLWKIYIGFVFTGGCLASALFFARRIWPGWALVVWAVLAGVTTLVIASTSVIATIPADGIAHGFLALQLGIWGYSV